MYLPYAGEIASLITALLWSFSSIIFTEASRKIGSQQLNINRLIIASIMLLVTVLLQDFSLSALQPQQYYYLIISGVIGLIIGDGFLFKSFQIIGARISMLIMSFVPALTAILAYIFLGETLEPHEITGMFITLSGILLAVTAQNSGNSGDKITLPGIFYGFMGALGQASGLLFAKSAFVIGEIDGFTAAFIRISSSTILFLPVLISIGKYKNPFILYRENFSALKLTLLGSLVGPYLGITFSLLAIKSANVAIASTLMATVPIIMLPILRVLYQEHFGWKGIAAALLAVAGIFALIDY